MLLLEDIMSTMSVQSTKDPVAGKKVAEVFGEIVWVMSRDGKYSGLSLADLETYVMPSILLRQFHITYAPVLPAQGTFNHDQNDGQNLQPVRVELFGLVSDRIKSTIDDHDTLPRLEPSEWRSGTNRIVVVDAKVAGFL